MAVFGCVRPWAVRLPGVGDYMAVFGCVRPWAVRLPGVGVTVRFFSIQGWLMTSMRGRRLWGSCRSNCNNRNDSRHMTYQIPTLHVIQRLLYHKRNNYWAWQFYSTDTKCTQIKSYSISRVSNQNCHARIHEQCNHECDELVRFAWMRVFDISYYFYAM